MKKNILRSLIITALLWVCASSTWAATWKAHHHFFYNYGTQYTDPYFMLMAFTTSGKVYVINLNPTDHPDFYYASMQDMRAVHGDTIADYKGVRVVTDDTYWENGVYDYTESEIANLVTRKTNLYTNNSFNCLSVVSYWTTQNNSLQPSFRSTLLPNTTVTIEAMLNQNYGTKINFQSDLTIKSHQVVLQEDSTLKIEEVTTLATKDQKSISVPVVWYERFTIELSNFHRNYVFINGYWNSIGKDTQSNPITTYTYPGGSNSFFIVYKRVTPKYAIYYDVIEGEGSLSAMAHNQPIASGDSILEGDTVIINAVPATTYQSYQWFVDGVHDRYRDNNSTYTAKIAKNDALSQYTYTHSFCFKKSSLRVIANVGQTQGTSKEIKEITVQRPRDGSNSWGYGGCSFSASYNDDLVLTVTPKDGYALFHWTDKDGNVLSLDNSFNHHYTSLVDDTIYAQLYKTKKLFLRPTGAWLDNDSRFAAYAWESGNPSNSRWFDMTVVGCTDVYTCDIHEIFDKVIFCRMNPDSDINDWSNCLAQTSEQTVPATTSTTNLFTAPTPATWESYYPNRVTINLNNVVTSRSGDIYITAKYTDAAGKAQTKTLKTTASTSFDVTQDTQLTLNIVYSKTYYCRVSSLDIKIGNQSLERRKIDGPIYPNTGTITLDPITICGETNIALNVVSLYNNRIYLRPNDEWQKDNARFAVYATSASKSGVYEWHELTTKETDYTGAYSASISQSFDRVVFVRLNPNGPDPDNNGLNWNNVWDQTETLTYSGSSRYAIDKKAWESSTVIWRLSGNTNYQFMGYPGKFSKRFTYRARAPFKLLNLFTGQYYTDPGTIVREKSDEWLPLSHDAKNDQTEFGVNFDVDAGADYQFNLQFVTVGDSIQKQISVTYPTNHYHLVYTDDTGVKRYGRYVEKITSGTKQYIVSFFINKDANPKIGISDSDADPTTWTNISVDESYVYNFTMEMTPDTVTLSNTYSKYLGNYYIRTDGAAGEWHNYQTNADNRLTQFDWQEGELYNYYWVKELSANSDGKLNVRACVANDYNSNLAGILIHDLYTDERGDVSINPQSETLNLRFGYSPYTNHFSRAMLTSTQHNDFLNIVGDNLYADKQCTAPLNASNANSKFTDLGDWIYEKHAYANVPNTSTEIRAQLLATAYNQQTQSLLGFTGNTPNTQVVLGAGTSSGVHNHRTIYDFKTNRLLMAWMPDNSSDYRDPENQGPSINANMLFMRRENEDATQFRTYAARGVLQKYFAMEFVKTNDATRPQEEQYFFSLPYSCTIQDVFGIPGYMSIWGIQRYRGDLRAEKGWFIETPTFWEWMQPTDQLLPGEGYVLIIDKSAAPWPEAEAGEESILRLYFPSSEESSAGIDSEHYSHEYPNEPCIITREQRDKQDSNWKMIGTTIYSNAAVQSSSEQAGAMWNTYPNFRYEYAYKNGKWGYTPVDGKTSEYKSFYGYMVQFAGTIQWTPANTAQQQLMARNNAATTTTSHQLRLELLNSQAEQEDQAFVTLEDGATTTFDQNKDLNKIINAGSNIYTLSEGIPFAGNSLPVGECVVPVGLQLAQAGEYTFTMPDGTDGLIVELIDYTTGARTDLLYFDYTVELTAGTINDRFALHLMPYKQGVSTQLDQAADALQDKHIIKCIIDGRLYMRKDGIWYDAQGRKVECLVGNGGNKVDF